VFNSVTKVDVATTRCAREFCAPESCLEGSVQILAFTPVVLNDVSRSLIVLPEKCLNTCITLSLFLKKTYASVSAVSLFIPFFSVK
jgi:hypothetical protein